MEKKKSKVDTPATPAPPKLVRRRENRKATFQLGRTIGAKREKLETANERAAARKKDKRKNSLRIIMTIIGFAAFAVILVVLFKNFTNSSDQAPAQPDEVIDYTPTIEIIDEAAATGSQLTSRMLKYIGRAEKDFRDLGYTPVKAVFPSTAIREVDFYLDDYPGFIKLTIDRDSAVSVEDADRMLRYLADKGITEFTYIDVRIDGKAYWK